MCFQQSATDCGVACLTMIARYHGLVCGINDLSRLFGPSSKGVSMYAINRAASAIGFKARGLRLDIDALADDVELPCIAYWGQNHFVVVSRIAGRYVHVADPAMGRVRYSRNEFLSRWAAGGDGCGAVLELKPENLHLPLSEIAGDSHGIGAMDLMGSYRRPILAIFLILLVAALVDLGVPVLTQWMFDRGLAPHDIGVVTLALAGQLAIVVGRNTFIYVQSRLSLSIGNRIGVELMRRLLEKFMRLPRSFFDFKAPGEVLQSATDVSRAENFLTSHIPQTLTSVLSVLVLSLVLLYYNVLIFLVYSVSVAVYYLWLRRFMARMRVVDYRSFEVSSRCSDEVIQFVRGINEIKLSGCADNLLRRWDGLREENYKVNRETIELNSWQSIGISVLSKIADIAVTFMTVMAVMDGRLSVGAMLAIQYVVGTMSYPSQQIIYFMRYLQDFRISMGRLGGIYSHPEERRDGDGNDVEPPEKGIELRNVGFRYDPAEEGFVLKDVNISIAANKTTAIVGSSGSGKTTLLKLIVGLYDPEEGTVEVDGCDLRDLKLGQWRSMCGSVFQESYIFNDSILANIAPSEAEPDREQAMEACRVACIADLIDSLPLGLDTVVGPDGMRLSNGQRQRLLVARAIYRRPSVLILDEATNSLDAVNESNIYRNLTDFFAQRTVVVAAHRLSTVRNADYIVVVDGGTVVEAGTHDDLMANRATYYNLVHNQL